jgi:hypothetical protein
MLVIFPRGTNKDGGPRKKCSMAEKADPLRTEINQSSLDLPVVVMGKQ